MESKSNKKIILVEDDQQLLAIYRKMFEQTDYDVETATSAHQISEELRLIRMGESEKPDLIIMDLMLPYANGAQVLKSIKKSHFTRDIPVFVLSNYHNNELRPEKYLIKTEHTPAQIMGIIGQHFAAKEVKTNLA